MDSSASLPEGQAPKRIADALCTAHFAGGLCLSTLITVTVNALVDGKMRQGAMSDPATAHEATVVFQQKTVVDVLIFTAFVSWMAFLGSASVTKRICSGDVRPISRAVLAASIFGSIVGTAGKRRLFKFVLVCLLFPGMAISVVMAAGCHLFGTDARASLPQCSASSFEGALAWTMLWKGVCAAIVYTLNYVAAHNDSQPELSAEATKKCN